MPFDHPVICLCGIVSLLYRKAGNRVPCLHWCYSYCRQVIPIVDLFIYSHFANRKPTIMWFHPPNPPAPTTGSCWWRTPEWHWIRRKMLQVGHLSCKKKKLLTRIWWSVKNNKLCFFTVGYVPDYFFITHQGVKKTEISGVSATRGSSLSFARWQLGEQLWLV